ncbi:MAG: HAD family phosphatase [Hungatella sp.]
MKNIIFDMGKVLINYDTERICKHFMSDAAERKEVSTAVFVSPEWLMLDMGILDEESALERMQSRLSTAHAKEMAKLCFDHWHEYCMWTKEGMPDVVRDLKEKGCGIYLCSNASVRLLSCYRDVIPEIVCFDGVLFSAEVQCMKPQKEMYEHLFQRFGLNPADCFFIDDLPMNIEGARACGMDGYCFADGDVERLRTALGLSQIEVQRE